jgi:hypothetical protein
MLITPGSTTTRWFGMSTSRILRILDMTMSIPASTGKAPPESPVPEPLATNGMPSS